MPWTSAGRVSDLLPGTMREIRRGERTVVVCNVDGQFHAMDGVCPHRGAPLGQGALHGPMVVCPWHAWEFDCRTGEFDINPELKQQRFDVRVHGDQLFVDIS